MPSQIIRVGAVLSAGFACLAASGCFVPGGGWTMRGGIDLRRSRKPSAFVELVDTRWDEYNRVAEMNMGLSGGAMIDARGAVTMPCPPGMGATGQTASPSGPALPPPNGLPPVPVPTPRETGPDGSPAGEPRQLPGVPLDPEPPPPPAGANTTARLPRGPDLFIGQPDENGESANPDRSSDQSREDALDAGPEADSDGENIELSSYKRGSAGAKGAKPRKKPLLRPAASRLFGK